MLDALLRLAADNSPLTASEAARSLGVTQTMAQALFEELARRGYLRAAPTTCSLPCKGCGAHEACAGRQARFWVLTAKGARASTIPRGGDGARDGAPSGLAR
jgi:predicted ArsR family transcriptional regulator